MKTFKQFQEEKKFGPDGKPISKKDDLLKRMSKGYDKNVKGNLKDLESKARKPTQSPDGSYEVKFKKDGTPYTKPSAPDAKTGADRIDNKTGSNMRKTKGQTYTKAPKTNTKSKTYGSNKNYRNRTQSEINRDFNKGIDDPSLKQSRTNIKSKTVGRNIKDIFKNAFGNKNKVKNPITKIGKPTMNIPKSPTVFSKVANVAKNLGPKGKVIALGALAGGVAYANRDRVGNLFNRIVGKKPVYTGGYGKGNRGLPPGSEGKPTHKMKQMYIKRVFEEVTNEGVMAIPAAAAVGKYVVPALMTGIGAVGTINQIKKNEKFGKQTKKGLKNIAKNIDRNKLEPDTAAEREELIAKSKPEVGKLVDKQVKSDKGMDKLLDKINSAQKPKRKYRTRTNKTVSKPKRKISDKEKKIFDMQKKDIMQKGSDELKTKGLIKRGDKFTKQTTRGTSKNSDAGYTTTSNRKPFDSVKSEPTIEKPPTFTGRVDPTKGASPQKRTTFKKPFSPKTENQFEDVVPTNNVGGGQIAGTVEAGDNPPVKKKKKKGEPTIIARGCMPGARNRFKGGVELLASFKKNKYT